MNHDHIINHTSAIKAGYCIKQSKYLKKWNRRLVVLTKNELLTYNIENCECTLHLYISKLREVIINNEMLIVIKKSNEKIKLKFESLTELNEWYLAINSSVLNSRNSEADNKI